MSAPLRNQHMPDGPLLYAPRKVRRSAPADLQASPLTDAPPTVPKIIAARTDVPLPRVLLYEGDVAIKDLRRRLSLDPDLAPQPPARKEKNSAVPWIGGLSLTAIISVIAASATMLVKFPGAGDIASMASPFRAAFSETGTAAPPARLLAKGQEGFTNEPVHLGVLLNGGSGSEPVQGKKDHVTPANPLEPPQAIQPREPDAIAAVDHFMKNGDILSARILLKRAARAGDAQATLELGMTFDPIVLTERGARGFAPDVAEARAWYQRAMALGSTEASRNLERLAGMEK